MKKFGQRLKYFNCPENKVQEFGQIENATKDILSFAKQHVLSPT